MSRPHDEDPFCEQNFLSPNSGKLLSINRKSRCSGLKSGDYKGLLPLWFQKRCLHGVLSILKLQQRRQHSVLSTLKLQQRRPHGVLPTLKLQQRRPHGVLATLKLQQRRPHSVLSILKLQQRRPHGVLSILKLQQRRPHGVLPILKLQQRRPHSVLPTLKLQQRRPHGVLSTSQGMKICCHASPFVWSFCGGDRHVLEGILSGSLRIKSHGQQEMWTHHSVGLMGRMGLMSLMCPILWNISVSCRTSPVVERNWQAERGCVRSISRSA